MSRRADTIHHACQALMTALEDVLDVDFSAGDRLTFNLPPQTDDERQAAHHNRQQQVTLVASDPLHELRNFQQGRCAVCDEERANLVVDHDHETGLVRGLLCNTCNSTEGRDFRAPWFTAYRENPPAQQIGLLVKYGDHRPPRPVRDPRTLVTHAEADAADEASEEERLCQVRITVSSEILARAEAASRAHGCTPAQQIERWARQGEAISETNARSAAEALTHS